MNNMFKRLLSVVMVVAMVMSFGVMPVSAEDSDGTPETGCSHSWENGVCTVEGCGAVCDHPGAAETVTPATCTEAGAKTVICGVCEFTSVETLPATGHSYVDGVCTVEGCGAEEPKEEPEETPAECTCEVLCSENAGCDFCAVEGNKCKFDESGDEKEPAFVPCTVYPGDCALADGHDGDCVLNCGCPIEGGEHVEGCTLGLYANAPAELSNSQINMNDPNETFLSAEITELHATSKVEIYLFSEGTHIATTTLQDPGLYNTSPLGVKIMITGDSGTWYTDWVEGMLSPDYQPTTMELHVDGSLVDTANVPMIRTNGEASVEWKDVPGVKVYPVNVTTAEGATTGYDTLVAAVGECTGGETITLAAGEYTLPTSIPAVTIKGTTKEGTIINFGEAGNQSIASVTDITFDTLTINKGNADYRGFYGSNSETYNNCIINGELWTYANTASFTGCEFNQTVTGWDYNIWTYSARTLSFTNCTFNSVGKAMNVYNEGACANDITITNCKFIATQDQGKSAIEIGTSFMPSGTTVKIDANTTETGFVAGNYSGNSLWNEKTNTKTGISIFVGTEQVWPIFPATVVADKFNKGCTSLDEALTEANKLTGDVTIEIRGKVEYTDSTPNLNGTYDSISFVGKTDDAEISITRNGSNGYISGQGASAKVNFTDLILSKPAGNFADDAGFMNVAFSVYRTGEVTYTNCTFPNGACAAGPKTTYNECTFQKSHDKYALWAYGANVTVNGGTFDDDRGIKMYDENKGANNTTVLTVSGADFSKLTAKPAIVLTLGKSVTLSDNTYSSTGVFELEDNCSSNGTTVSADLKDIACKSDDYTDCGALVDGKIYRTVTDAETAGAIKDNSTIALFYDCSAPTEHVEAPVNVKVINNGYDDSGIIIPAPAAYIEETGNKYDNVEEALEDAEDMGNNHATVALTDKAEDGDYDVAGNTTVELNGTSIWMHEGGELELNQDGTSRFTPDTANEADGIVVIEGVGYVLVNGASVTVDENGNWEIVGNYYQVATANNLIFKPDQNHHKYNDPDMTVECTRFMKDCTGIYITGKEYGENNALWIYNPLTRAANAQIKVEQNVNGGIKVTLPTSYLNARNGNYKIHFLFGTDEVSGDFTVYETYNYVADTTNPKTGDAIFAPAMMMLFSASALAVLLLGKKKHA